MIRTTPIKIATLPDSSPIFFHLRLFSQACSFNVLMALKDTINMMSNFWDVWTGFYNLLNAGYTSFNKLDTNEGFGNYHYLALLLEANGDSAQAA